MSINALKEGENFAKESAIHLLAFGLLKVFAGFITGMTVIFADGINTLAAVLGIFE